MTTALDRSLDAMRRLVASFFPALLYYVVHEYVVAESDGTTFAGTPTDGSFSPQLPTRVPYAPSLAGSSCVAPVGMLAYVGFANADPGKPYLVRFGPGLPTTTTIDANGPLAIGPTSGAVTGSPTTPMRLVREGDTYTAVGNVPGTVVLTLSLPAMPSGPTAAKG